MRICITYLLYESGLPCAVEKLLAQSYGEDKGRQLRMLAQLTAMRKTENREHFKKKG